MVAGAQGVAVGSVPAVRGDGPRLGEQQPEVESLPPLWRQARAEKVGAMGSKPTEGEARLMAAMLRESAKLKAERDEFETAIAQRDASKKWTSIARHAKKDAKPKGK